MSTKIRFMNYLRRPNAASLPFSPCRLVALSQIVKGRTTEASTGATAIVVGSDVEREMGCIFR